MFYFLFLNIFRRHQRNFHFNPVHFDSGASPLFFLLLGIGGFHLSIRRSSTVYRSICIHTIGKRRRRHQRFPTGSSSSLRCGWCQPPGDSVDASTYCSSFFSSFYFFFFGWREDQPGSVGCFFTGMCVSRLLLLDYSPPIPT